MPAFLLEQPRAHAHKKTRRKAGFFESRVGVAQSGRTCSACMPFWPFTAT
jgi:hypothetical protein